MKIVKKGRPQHGMRGHRDYSVWSGAKNRVTNENDHHWERYGGRGIIMYSTWLLDPVSFIEYIRLLPNYGVEGYSIDRVNNDYGYEPMNLRWASRITQAQNSANNGRREYRDIPVHQFTKDMDYIATYNNFKDASIAINGNSANIAQCIRREKASHKGFIWMKAKGDINKFKELMRNSR